MKKITKLLVAFVMLFGLGLLFINNLPKAKAAGTVSTLQIDGQYFANPTSNLSGQCINGGEWTYLYPRQLILRDYHGLPITMISNSNETFSPTIKIYGECVITADNYSNGITLENSGSGMQSSIEFCDEWSSLTIVGGKNGIVYTAAGVNDNYFTGDEKNNKLTIINSTIGINANYNGSLFFVNDVNTYINSEKYSIYGAISNGVLLSVINDDRDCSLTLVSKNEIIPTSSSTPRMYGKSVNAKEYVSSDHKVYHIASEEKFMQGFLQFTDLTGNIMIPNNKNIGIEIGESEELGFNNIPLPSQLSDYSIVRELDFRKNGDADHIIHSCDIGTENLSYNFTPEDSKLYILQSTLSLTKDGEVIAELKNRNKVSGVKTHSITTDISGLIIIPLSHSTCEVKTGETFNFKFQIEENYVSGSDMDLFVNGDYFGKLHSSGYTIENVRDDIIITSTKKMLTQTHYSIYSEETYVDGGIADSGHPITLITLDEDFIPTGMAFDYWQVGDRTIHYNAGDDITFTEEERGDIIITAHFTGVYNITIDDGHFYDSAAFTSTHIIYNAAQGSSVYFQFNYPKDEIISGKMFYDYNAIGISKADIDDYGTYWEISSMPANDIRITPIYKYVIDEMTVLNVKQPVGNTKLIENQECAPEDANYIVETYSQWYKIDGLNRTLVSTNGYGNPYVFENNTTYEVEIRFRYKDGFIFNPNGYNRDSDYQFYIDGLDDLQYEVVSCDFTNSSKNLYKVILRFNSINKYEVSVTDGSAYIGTNVVEYATYGETILLSADVAPSGMAFDSWIITGITVDEDALNGSKLSITMPDNSITAVATYKDVEHYEVTFNPNGGTGSISDDTSYGDYILPFCTFEAPEHKHFKCWNINGVEYDEYAEITVSENVEVKAIWEYDTFTISFDNNGGTGSMDSETKEYGSIFTLPECTFTAPTNKRFVGWSKEAEGSIITTTIIEITSDVILYAIYENIPEDVTLTKIELSGTYKTKYTVGDTFSSDGIVVTATYSDNTTQNIALSLVTISGYNLSNEGTQTVTVTYEGKTATFTITVEKKSTPDPVDPVDPVNPDPVTPDDPTPSPKKKNNAGLIIGITLGSVALCAAVAVGAVLIIKKKH